MVNTLALIFTTLVAVEHLYIACVEMFMWDTMGKRIFKKTMRPELFSETKGLAANLGLYNGLLAVGLIIGLCLTEGDISLYLRYLFLSFVGIAAIFGAIRSDWTIMLKQGLPAFIALALTALS